MNNQFSENLKKIRKEHNLSQEQLADELGVSSRLEFGQVGSFILYSELHGEYVRKPFTSKHVMNNMSFFALKPLSS